MHHKQNFDKTVKELKFLPPAAEEGSGFFVITRAVALLTYKYFHNRAITTEIRVVLHDQLIVQTEICYTFNVK